MWKEREMVRSIIDLLTLMCKLKCKEALDL
jgi:hypothetical protein